MPSIFKTAVAAFCAFSAVSVSAAPLSAVTTIDPEVTAKLNDLTTGNKKTLETVTSLYELGVELAFESSGHGGLFKESPVYAARNLAQLWAQEDYGNVLAMSTLFNGVTWKSVDSKIKAYREESALKKDMKTQMQLAERAVGLSQFAMAFFSGQIRKNINTIVQEHDEKLSVEMAEHFASLYTTAGRFGLLLQAIGQATDYIQCALDVIAGAEKECKLLPLPSAQNGLDVSVQEFLNELEYEVMQE